MYIIKNSFKNLLRNKGRNLIVALILLIMILAIGVSVIIHTSAKSTIEYYKAQFGAQVILARNNSKVTVNPSDDAGAPPSLEDVLSYAQSELLNGSLITVRNSVAMQGIQALDQDKNKLGNSGASDFQTGVTPNGNSDTNYSSPNAFILASNIPEISSDFKSGLRKIVKGSAYKGKGEIVISEALAKLNKLDVGDTITLNSWDPYHPDEKPASYTVKICGIYEDNAPPNMNTEVQNALSNRGNEIFMSIEGAKESGLLNNDLTEIMSTFILKNPNDLQKLQKEFYQKGLPQHYELIADTGTYDILVGPLKSLSNITMTFMVALLIFGGVVLVVLSVIAIRERKYEIGVLRAIGMKKAKVCLGLVLEMFIITAFCLTLALGIAGAGSKPIANAVLSSQAEEARINYNPYEISSQYVANTPTVTVPIDKIDTALSADAILQIVLFAMGLAILSSAAGVFYVTKFEPSKILSERN